MKKGDTLQIKVNEPEKAMTVLKNINWITSIVREDDKLLIGVKAEKYAEISAVLARESIFVTEMRAKEDTLEEFFLEMTEERIND
jgi:hypothetical protein